MKINKDNKKYFLLAGLLLIILGIFILLYFKNPFLIWDENVYLGNARSHISYSAFTEDFRFPMIEYVISFFWLFTGESIFVAKLVAILFSLLSITMFFFICDFLFKKNKDHSIIFTSLFAFSFLILHHGFRVYTDVSALALILTAVFFAFKSQDKNISKNLSILFVVLAGVFSSLSFLMKFSSIIVSFSIFVYYILNKKWKDLYIFSVFSILTICPWLIYNIIHYGNPIWDVLYYQNAITKWTEWQPISLFLKHIYNNMKLFLLFMIPGLISFFNKIKFEFKEKKPKNYSLISIYTIISLIYYMFFINLKDERYFLMVLPFFLIISFEGFNFLKKRIKRLRIKSRFKKFFTYLLLFILIFNAFSLLAPRTLFNEPCAKDNSVFDSIKYIENSDFLNENDTIMSNYWPNYAYYFNVKPIVFWDPDDTDALILEEKPELLIIKENDGTWYNESKLNHSKIIFDRNFSDSCGGEVKIYRIRNN